MAEGSKPVGAGGVAVLPVPPKAWGEYREVGESTVSFDLVVDLEFKTLIPSLDPNELKDLEESILGEGCRDALVVWKETDTLLDGHNRLEICKRLGKPYQIKLLSLPSRDAAKIWIINNQFARRNLSPYQRSVLGLKLENIYREKAKENERLGGGDKKSGLKNSPNPIITPVDTRKELAKIARVSDNTIAKVKAIEEKATPEQKAKLVTGEATINQVYVQVHRQEVKEQIKQTQWPTGKYRIIYADPPWQYSNSQPDYQTVQDDHYPTMPLNDICKLPVGEISLDDAVLFLWATSPILEDAFKVINAWGFKYKASFIWDKVKHNMGHYNSLRHEFLLIAVRGSCQPDNLELFDSVQTIERTAHSAKPAAFRTIIGTLYPYGKRIELFARAKANGWEQYGNQIA